MLNWWNNLPSSFKDMVRLLVVLVLQQLIAAIQSPPTVNVASAPAVVNVQPAPVVFNSPPVEAKK